jgi:hypothetical protein
MSLADAQLWFAAHDATLVLSHTTISEFVPADESDGLRIRWELQQLERFSPVYIRLGDLACAELFLADRARASGEEYPRFEPYVPTFWRTFWSLYSADGEDIVFRRELERRVAYRLDEQVFELWVRPDNFRNLAQHTTRLQNKIRSFREDSRPRKLRYRNELSDTLSTCEWGTTDVEPLAKWLNASPTRAPGWRLTYEVLEQWRSNTGDDAKPGDIHDLTHVGCVPYVDAATLDGRFVTYVNQAAKEMRTRVPAIDYEHRVFRSFADMVAAPIFASA